MARFGKRGIGDFIPARGEAEVTARVKGAYGGKANMYRRSHSRYKRNSTKNPEAQYANGIYGNVNWADGRPNLMHPVNAGSGPVGVPQRLLSFNADTVAGNEHSAQCFLRRINVELGFMAQISQANVVGDATENNKNTRHEIPQPGPFFDGTSSSGALIGGDYDDNTLLGGTSWVEGTPITLFMVYETLAQANEAFDATFSEGSIFSDQDQRNSRFFWQKLIIPAAYRPEKVNIKKNFPGAGVRLSKGDREIYQVTIGYQGFQPAGTLNQATTAFVTGENRFWYFLDKP